MHRNVLLLHRQTNPKLRKKKNSHQMYLKITLRSNTRNTLKCVPKQLMSCAKPRTPIHIPINSKQQCQSLILLRSSRISNEERISVIRMSPWQVDSWSNATAATNSNSTISTERCVLCCILANDSGQKSTDFRAVSEFGI